MTHVNGKEHTGLAYIKKQVAEIERLESEHSYAACRVYVPGRCPVCLRIRSIEQENIQREMLTIEEDVAEALLGIDTMCALGEMTTEARDERRSAALRLLATGDVYRCHPRGEWPRSRAEFDEDYRHLWLPPMLRRRLGGALPVSSALVDLVFVPLYQQFYHEACLERWELAQFEHYSPAGEGKLSISYFQM